jgi:calcineurin-like phosphoesterase family protein
MNRVLMDNWNGVVGGMDVVWMLGDFGVARKGAPPLSRIVRDLKGKKILVVGNHDYETYSKYIDWGFSAVMHEAIVEVSKARVLLRHTPIVGGVKIYDGVDYVLHGHIHQTPTLEVRNATEAFRQLNVSVEQIKYAPISLEAAVVRVRKQALKYG